MYIMAEFPFRHVRTVHRINSFSLIITLLGIMITGVDTTQPDLLINTWTEFWSVTSGTYVNFSVVLHYNI